MPINIIVSSIVLLLISSSFAQFEGKTLLFGNGLSFPLDPLFPSRTDWMWSSLSSSELCDKTICVGTEQNSYLVRYSDAPTQDVVVCICSSNPVMNFTHTADKFAMVPLSVRKYVRGISVASKGVGGGAYSSEDIIRMFEFFDQAHVFIHESAHSLDSHAGAVSYSPPFSTALSSDSCVPDDYSRSSLAEDFAQLVVTWIYMVISNRTNDPFFNCLKNQIAIVAQYVPASSIIGQPSTTGRPLTTGRVIPSTTGSSTGQCPSSGYMRCSSSETYQTCSSQTGSLKWGVDQRCGTGLQCKQSGNYVYCDRPSSSTPSTTGSIILTTGRVATPLTTGSVTAPSTTGSSVSSKCSDAERGFMRCSGRSQYQTCDHGMWNPNQSCSSNLVCSQNGNYINCIRP